MENLEKQGEDSAAEEPKSDKSEETADLVEEQKSRSAQVEKNKEEKELVKPKGMKLNFVAPTIKNGIPIACMEQSEIEKEAIKWKRAIILYVIGDSPTISYLSYFLENQCHICNKPEIFFHNEGYFVVRFATTEDKEKLLYEGPHTMANRPVIVKEWFMDLSFEKEILKEIPLWIQLPKLPLNCWSCDSLSRTGSVLGKPICADECTTQQSRISYARLLVEVDVTQPLQYSIQVEGEGGLNVEQKVYYEWVPPFCKKCQRVGHICREGEPRKPQGHRAPQQKWQERVRNDEQEKGKMEGKRPLLTGDDPNKKDDGWTVPKKHAPSPMIQVGNIHTPTDNGYQAIQGIEPEDEDTTEGGDLIPSAHL